MPTKPNEVECFLLAACRTNGNIGLAERLMKYLYELDPGVDSNYATDSTKRRWDLVQLRLTVTFMNSWLVINLTSTQSIYILP
ncbi:hypothetical protein GBA52_020552 [Prunus armeniaca]|nr:hypothetical protein GBA52_020552 [Prunus armeniaca]